LSSCKKIRTCLFPGAACRSRPSSRKLKTSFPANPDVKAAAIVGVEGVKKIILNAVMLFSKRKFHTFDNIESAKNWLVAN
jgi:hypothetical protein